MNSCCWLDDGGGGVGETKLLTLGTTGKFGTCASCGFCGGGDSADAAVLKYSIVCVKNLLTDYHLRGHTVKPFLFLGLTKTFLF